MNAINMEATRRDLENREARLRADLATARVALGRALLLDMGETSASRDRIAELREAIADVECMRLALPDLVRSSASVESVMRDSAAAEDRRERRKAAEKTFHQAVDNFKTEVAKLRTEPERIELAARLWIAARATENQVLIGHAMSVTDAYHAPQAKVRERVEVLRTRVLVAA